MKNYRASGIDEGALKLSLTWPPCSFNLTPANFFQWGFAKGLVYKRTYENLAQLNAGIAIEFQQVFQDMFLQLRKTF